MAVLIVGATERERISEIKAYSKAHPVPLALVKQGIQDHTNFLALKDRKPGLERPPSQHMTFPGGYRAAYSIEEQPAGLCSHLSVSVIRFKKGAMPSVPAVEMIAREFGVPWPPEIGWTEEFEPGEYAINLVSPL